jgi:eukaryotic-like serine/threonine-protein kinase
MTALGQYEIRGRLGSGGMGDVYDAVHKMLDKRVALKTLRRKFLDDQTIVARFLREGQLASRMRHPNIVDVTDVGMIGGLPCLVMEHLDGEPFSALIKREGGVPLGTLVDLLLPIIAALEFAHERGVLHRDLKPSNIFLARAWNGELVPKLLDFGISKLVNDEGGDHQALTTESAFVGTPLYAPPEMMRSAKNLDGRSDQYSVGVMLYEAATGVRPFGQDQSDFVGLAMAICNGEFRPPRHVKPDLPEAFERIVMRAMSLRIDDRFPSMNALGEALLPFASERLRMIWLPVFRGAGDRPPTQVAVVEHTAAIVSRPPISATGPNANAPTSGGFWSAPMTPAPHSGPHSGPHTGPNLPASYGPGSMTGPPMSSQTPAPLVDRTPSYAQGGTVPSARAPQASGGSAWVWVTMTLGVLVMAAVVGVKTLRPKPRAADEASGTAAVQPVAAATYAVDVAVVPESATIEIDGIHAGTGKLARSFPADARQHVIRVAAPGYESVQILFTDERAIPKPITLARASGAAGAAGHAAPGTGGQGGGAARPAPAGTAKGKGADTRPKTDNIDPWE